MPCHWILLKMTTSLHLNTEILIYMCVLLCVHHFGQFACMHAPQFILESFSTVIKNYAPIFSISAVALAVSGSWCFPIFAKQLEKRAVRNVRWVFACVAIFTFFLLAMLRSSFVYPRIILFVVKVKYIFYVLLVITLF